LQRTPLFLIFLMIDKQLTDSGAKAQQRTDNEDRAKIYRDWHRTLRADLAMFDVDTIEWRQRNGELVAVAVIELTRTDSDNVSENYLKAILDRFDVRDKQGEASRKVAKALGVDAHITLFNPSCQLLNKRLINLISE
jgi:hypothetical protein